VTILAEVVDPDGRRVELTVERWQHIIGTESHPELATHREAVLRAVKAPNRRLRGRKQNEEWFYLAGVGPSQWLKVVVAYAQGRGFITTAFARRSFP
jgi:hypothetical protein